MNTRFSMHPLEVMKTYAPPFGDSWFPIIKDVLSDKHENTRIDELAFELEYGDSQFFNRPVVITSTDEDGSFVADGIHRLLASLKLNRHVLCQIDYTDTPEPEVVQVSVNYQDEETYDAILSLLSFRLDEDTWVQWDGATSNSHTDVLNVYMLCPHSKRYALRDAVMARLTDNLVKPVYLEVFPLLDY